MIREKYAYKNILICIIATIKTEHFVMVNDCAHCNLYAAKRPGTPSNSQYPLAIRYVEVFGIF